MSVFITSPSRVGSNWLCDILVDLLKPISMLRLYTIKHLLTKEHRVPVDLIKKLDSMKGNNLFKIHIWKPEELINVINGVVIGLVRNYEDSVSSLLNWIKKSNDLKISIEELREERKEQIQRHEEMFDSMYFEHKRYCLIHYEDLMADPIKTIKFLCEFLKIKREDEDIERIVDLNRFDYKKQTINDDSIVNNYLTGVKQ